MFVTEMLIFYLLTSHGCHWHVMSMEKLYSIHMYVVDIFHVVGSIGISVATFVSMSAKSYLLRLDSEGCDHKKLCRAGLYYNMQLSL